tara:strand:- start:3202 stop:3435 length:234 start_codon:yes stop_codon:yes gene_type:complete
VSETRYNNLTVGDLVIYAPYFEGEGAWVMTGDLGIVLEVKILDNIEIVKVKWINLEMDENDMAADVLVKLENKDENK